MGEHRACGAWLGLETGFCFLAVETYLSPILIIPSSIKCFMLYEGSNLGLQIRLPHSDFPASWQNAAGRWKAVLCCAVCPGGTEEFRPVAELIPLHPGELKLEMRHLSGRFSSWKSCARLGHQDYLDSQLESSLCFQSFKSAFPKCLNWRGDVATCCKKEKNF